MASSKRLNSENIEAFSSKKSRPNNGEQRAIHAFNESLTNDRFESSFISSPSATKASRVSLNRVSIRPHLSKFAAKDGIASSSLQEEEQPILLSAVEYNKNLKSLQEVMSKSFDPKNAFKYDFINIMNSFMKNDKGEVDFKIVALSLEAGTKVWTSKVDSVFRHTHKLTNSLSMATDDRRQLDSDEDNALDETINRNEKKRKKKKKNLVTIASNPATLNGKFDINIEVDPLFYHFSAAFDVGNVNSLLMANLSGNPSGTFLLNSTDKLDFTSFENPASVPVNYPTLRRCIPPSMPKVVCPPIDGFNIRDFIFSERESEIELNQSKQAEESAFVFDIDAEVEDFDPGAISDDDFNDTNHILDAPTNTHDQSDAQAASFIENNLVRFLPDNDNQFFSKNFLKQIFRKLPGRFKKSKLLLQNSDASPKSKIRKRISYRENEYDLNGDFSCFERTDTYKFTPATLQKWITNSDHFRIKDDFGFSNSQLKSTFSKPRSFFKHIFKEIQLERQEKDSTNEFMDDHDPPNDFAGDDGVEHDDETTNVSAPRPYDLNEEEPVHVDALDIDYARVAKKIDIKRVKKGMWEEIKDSSTDTQSLVNTDKRKINCF